MGNPWILLQYILPLLLPLCPLSICLLFLVGVALVFRWLWNMGSAEKKRSMAKKRLDKGTKGGGSSKGKQ